MLAFNPDYEVTSLFKHYVNDDPKSFTISASIYCGIMFVWAYALLRVRTFYKQNHTQVNFHFGLLLIISSCFLYPIRVSSPSSLYTLGLACLFTGVPLALGNLMIVSACGMNKKTGSVIMLTPISMITGYVISYVRYEEEPAIM